MTKLLYLNENEIGTLLVGGRINLEISDSLPKPINVSLAREKTAPELRPSWSGKPIEGIPKEAKTSLGIQQICDELTALDLAVRYQVIGSEHYRENLLRVVEHLLTHSRTWRK